MKLYSTCIVGQMIALQHGESFKVRLQTFVDYMEERLAPNSVRQYAKLKAVLNLYNEEVELPKDYNKILSVKCEKH